MQGHTSSPRQLTAHWSETEDASFSSSSIRQHLLHCGLRARLSFLQNLLPAITSMPAAAVCSGTYETRMQIAVSCFYLTNPGLTCDTTMAAFILNVMPLNATFRSAISNIIVDEHRKLWSGMLLDIMDYRSCYDLRII